MDNGIKVSYVLLDGEDLSVGQTVPSSSDAVASRNCVIRTLISNCFMSGARVVEENNLYYYAKTNVEE